MPRSLSTSAAMLTAALCGACASAPDTPKAPEARWVAPAEAIPPAPKPPPPPPEASPERLAKRKISLYEAIDVALANSPVTRQSWFLTQAAAADVGSRRSAYYPVVEADLSGTRQKQSALGGSVTTLSTTYAPSVSLNWLLLDLGGRAADVEETKRRLVAANFVHDAAMNDLILGVAQAYYLYEGARALLVAQEASLKQARENYAAAEERHRAGVATIADVLQARTVVSQQKLAYDQVSGQIQTFRGQLATTLGVPVDLPVEAADLPEDVHEDASVASVDRLIAEAEKSRPELAAVRARAQAAHARVTSARSAGLPTLSASAFAGRNYYDFFGESVPYNTNYSLGILLRVPLFTGFKTVYDTRSAEAAARAADAGAETYAQQVIFQVWNAYFGVQTSAQQVRAAKDLLASARESAEVARGRYREGVGSILDLLTAESALASALAQDVRSRAGFLLAVAQLAHDAGTADTALIPVPERKEAP
ncbi:MAG TPA: TolC family protein [Thermoanaerobaculia bacterium]|nr:TolC family protein [Thermoanaerobaculia bacterium]